MSALARRAIEEYLSIKEQIAALEARATNIRNDFATELAEGNMEKMLVPLSEETVYQIKQATRTTKSCDWVTFKARNPELFGEVVRESTSTYVDIRKVKATNNG